LTEHAGYVLQEPELTEFVKKTRQGAIVYDSDIFDQVSEDLFRARGWQSVEPVRGTLRAAGRGNTLIVSDGGQDFVLRKYVRGGLVGRLIKDTYFWNGEDDTRCFAEWRLLRNLVKKGLNVPIPAAAYYRRTAMFYTADLLTVRIPGIQSLADRIMQARGSDEFWESLGVAICRIHAEDVYHADMNAYNIQLDENDEVWLLDFDRGELSPTGTWKQETLSRLHRSLRKITSLSPGIHFDETNWQKLLDGYFSESRSE
jgi:3-deoxy-D-manno-octulosonic acid kinase